MILEAVIPALLPVLTDGARGLFNRLTNGAGSKPASVEESIRLAEAETERLKTIAEIDNAEGVSQWVSNIRALQRPVATALILGAYVGAVASQADAETINGLSSYAQMATFYLFGDRTYVHLKKGR